MTQGIPMYGSRGKVWIHFFAYSFGIFFTYSAYGCLLGLQSSLNIVDNVGTKTNAAIYGSAVGGAILLMPLLLRRFGPRTCLISTVVSFVCYISANFYPSLYTMMPAAIMVGVGDTLLWTCMPIYNSYFAKEYERLTENGKQQTSRFSGYFFGIFQSAKIFVNPICYFVLQAFHQDDRRDNNSTFSTLDDVMFCGANDCQDPDLVQENISNYVPDRVATNILLGGMILLCCIAGVLHLCFLPRVEVSSFKNNDRSEKKRHALKTHLSFVISTFKDIVKQIFVLKQLLLSPIVFYLGFDYGLITSELSRAYSSCIFGISWVPIHLSVYGMSAALFSALTGKLSRYISKIVFVCFAATVDTVTYMYYFFWTPDASTQWAVIPVFVFAGGMQGMLSPILQAVQAETFSENLDVGSPIWNFWYMLGICVQFAISPLTCVGTKIISHIVVLSVALIGFVALEVLLRKESKRKSTESIGDEQKVASHQDTHDALMVDCD